MSRADLPPSNGEFFSGDSKRLVFNVSGVVLTGYTVTFAVFRYSTKVFEKTTGNGVDVSANSFTVTLEPANTADLKGNLSYEVEGRGPNGEVVTLAWGDLKITADKIVAEL